MKINSIMKRFASVFLSIIFIVLTLPSLQIEAASQYTITFRPGNVGKFNLDDDTLNMWYGSGKWEITANGAIKVTVSYGEPMPATYPNISPNEGYFVRMWGPSENENSVEKNLDFVVDYGKLVNGVEYTVEYVDVDTKESVAPSSTSYGNVGDFVEKIAPTSLQTSAYGVYQLQGSSKKSIESLDEDATKNIITFEYLNTYDPGTVVEEIVNYEDGGTTVVTDTIHTVLNQEGNLEPGVAQLNQDNDEEVDNTPENNENIIIEDEDTPLANQVEENKEPGVVVIDDETVPLDSTFHQGMNPIVFCAIIAGIAVVLMTVVWVFLKKKKAMSQMSDDSE